MFIGILSSIFLDARCHKVVIGILKDSFKITFLPELSSFFLK